MRALTLITLGLLASLLSGCYVYPAPAAYPYPYYDSYYADPYYAGPYAGNAYPQAAAGPEADDQQYCREYTYKIRVDNSTQNARGVACRQPDGSWKEVD